MEESKLTRSASRRRSSPGEKPQQITRIPVDCWPGKWVKIKDNGKQNDRILDLSGKVRQVKSLTCSITKPDQKYAVWRVHFEDGRSLLIDEVERPATDAEITVSQRRVRV